MKSPATKPAPPHFLGGDGAALVAAANRIVTEHYRVDIAGVRGPRRITWARQVRDWLLAESGFFTSNELKLALHRDRKTFSVSVQSVRDARQCYPAVTAETDALRAQFHSAFRPPLSASK